MTVPVPAGVTAALKVSVASLKMATTLMFAVILTDSVVALPAEAEPIAQ